MRPLPSALLALLITTSCSGETSSSGSSSGTPAASDRAATPQPGTDATPTASPTEPAPSTTSVSDAGRATSPSSFAAAVAPLIAGHTPSADALALAWEHYKAERFADAQREFALASLHEPGAWKHPFNLACASARAGDEAMTRVALSEALARDASKVRAKARKDADLAPYREAPWFVAALDDETRPNAAGHDEPRELDPATLTSLPPPLGAQPLPPGSATPLAKAELARVRKALAAKLGLEPTLRGSIALSGPDSQPLAFVVYDFTETQACKAEAQGDREALAFCLEDLMPQEAEHSELANQTKCVQQYLVRVELAAELRFGDPLALEVACHANEVRRLDAVDLDADGQLELVLDTIGATAITDMFGDRVYSRARQLAIVGLDGVVRYQLAHEDDAGIGVLAVERVFVRDGNGDGHPDLVVQRVEKFDDLECAAPLADTDFWPRCNEFGWQGHVLTSTLLLYEPARDTWVAPSGTPAG